MQNVAILDSGIGGLALLRKLYFSMPANYIYMADTANFPYGNKTKNQLQYICEGNLLNLLQKHDIDTAIIACNTATLATSDYLRKVFPQIEIVGCEPPLKQALQYTISSPLLVATPLTIQTLKSKQNDQILYCALPELAQMVENSAPNRDILSYIEQNLSTFSNFDCIALGCTHYSLAKTCFQQLYPALKVFDSIDGIFSRIKKLYRRQKSPKESTLTLQFSDNFDTNTVKYQKILDELFRYY